LSAKSSGFSRSEAAFLSCDIMSNVFLLKSASNFNLIHYLKNWILRPLSSSSRFIHIQLGHWPIILQSDTIFGSFNTSTIQYRTFTVHS
jgi:hypothetical protein